MSRPPEHLLQFVLAELGTTGSIDGNQRLLIRGKYVPKYVESLLRKYIGTRAPVSRWSCCRRRHVDGIVDTHDACVGSALCSTLCFTCLRRVCHLQDVQVPEHAPVT